MTYEEVLAKIDTYQRFSTKPGLERLAWANQVKIIIIMRRTVR